MAETQNGGGLTPEQQALAAANLKLVYKLAHRYKRAQVLSFDELVSEGTYALVRYIVPGYRPEHGAFSTYAIPSIARYLKRALRLAERRLTQEPAGTDRGVRERDRLDQLPAYGDEPEPQFDLNDYLEELTGDQYAVVVGRCGLHGLRVRTTDELALELGMSRERVAELHQQALRLMRLAALEDYRRAG